MAFCRKCGARMDDNAGFCTVCGTAAQEHSEVNVQWDDNPSTALKVLSFFFPVVGLIFFCVWHSSKPECARAYGKWALIGFGVRVVLGIIKGCSATALYGYYY